MKEELHYQHDETRELARKIQSEVQIKTDTGETELVTVTPEMRTKFYELNTLAKHILASTMSMLAKICHEVKTEKLYAAAGFTSFYEWGSAELNLGPKQLENYISLKENFSSIIEKANKDPLGEESVFLDSVGVKKLLELGRTESGKKFANGDFIIYHNGEEITRETFTELTNKEQTEALKKMRKEKSDLGAHVTELKKTNKELAKDLNLANAKLEHAGGAEALKFGRRAATREEAFGLLGEIDADLHASLNRLRQINLHDPEIEERKISLIKQYQAVLEAAETDWERFTGDAAAVESMPEIEDDE